MLDGVSGEFVGVPPRSGRAFIGRESMFALGLVLEVALIVAISVASGTAYHMTAYADAGPLGQFAMAGLLVAALFETPLLVHSHYRTENELAGRRSILQIANAWIYAFLFVAVIALLTKTGDQLSRGWLLLFFVIGAGAVIGFELAMRRGLNVAASRGISVAPRRLAVIGTGAEIERFRRDHLLARTDIEIVAESTLPEAGWRNLGGDKVLAARIEAVVDSARRAGVTDVVVLADWAQGTQAMRIADLFLDLPVAVHLGRIGVVEEFPQMRVAKLGNARTLVLRSEPLSITQVLAKRAFDIVVSVVALVLLAPVLAVVALLIKLDSKGPVLFHQRRRGFNHKEFRIWKFRTMTTLDDGDVIKQAKQHDERITRLGKLLRRYNIDELPQLINVVLGDMSLVGPRPHAVAHDRHYERVISRYARRLNVKPGITGWAQINGHRGATEHDGAMHARVVHDLHYIENWSIVLDVYILVMTVLSRRAYRNAH